VVNTIGSGIVENPAFMPYLPDLCERLLGQPLRLPSVRTWWCGDPDGLRYVTEHLDELVIRPTSRGRGRSVRAVALSRAQRERVLAMIRANPHRYVGQQVLNLSSAPTTADDQLVPRNVVLRSFAVRDGASYTAMLGGLARVSDDTDEARGVLVTAPGGGIAKDVWVVSDHPIVAGRPAGVRVRSEVEHLVAPVDAATAAMVPRVLADLFWFGRYAERAEDLLRLTLAARTVAIETDMDLTPGHALEVLLQAVTKVSTTYPGFLTAGREMMPELRALLLERHRSGTAAQSLSALSLAAQGVRDQLSDDVWMVLADIERASAALAANPYDQGLQLTDASERILSGLLALAGIVSENLVRDAGWYMLDTGRGLERALQVLSLLQATICAVRPWDTERVVVEAVLTASESIVTYRRRYRGRDRVEAAVELLVSDMRNPRSVAYQVERILGDLRAIPNASPTARPLRLADALAHSLRQVDLAELLGSAEGPSPAGRSELGAFLTGLSTQLGDLSQAIRDQYQQLPPMPQPMWGNSSGGRQ
jgi:uncharacterized alpha-E superfamily protein